MEDRVLVRLLPIVAANLLQRGLVVPLVFPFLVNFPLGVHGRLLRLLVNNLRLPFGRDELGLRRDHGRRSGQIAVERVLAISGAISPISTPAIPVPGSGATPVLLARAITVAGGVWAG